MAPILGCGEPGEVLGQEPTGALNFLRLPCFDFGRSANFSRKCFVVGFG